jgi:hypothetical protein
MGVFGFQVEWGVLSPLLCLCVWIGAVGSVEFVVTGDIIGTLGIAPVLAIPSSWNLVQFLPLFVVASTIAKFHWAGIVMQYSFLLLGAVSPPGTPSAQATRLIR